MVSKALAVATLVTVVVGANPIHEFDVPGAVRSLSRSPDGRAFLSYAANDLSQGPGLVEYFATDGKPTTKAYPNDDWNNPDRDAAQKIIAVTAQRVGPDGYLYVLDSGMGQEPIDDVGGPPAKLVQIDLGYNQVSNFWGMGEITTPNSYLVDFRVNNNLVYITDAGAPAIIILDLDTGDARRVLEDAHSTRSHFAVSAEGHVLRMATNNAPYNLNVSYLELSPDAKYVYFGAGSGGLHRVETQYLNAKDVSALEDKVEYFALTVSSGGTAIDADGNLYTSDLDFQRIVKISPDGQQTELIQDADLLYANLWIDSSKKLYMTASQINRAGFFNAGNDLFWRPFKVFSIDIGVGPPPNDHK